MLGYTSPSERVDVLYLLTELLGGVYMRKSTVCGWGINDASYHVQKFGVLNGKAVRLWTCPYYQRWYGMIERVKSKLFKQTNPSYRDCTIAEEWKYFSNFIRWVDSQPNKNWQNCHLDKDVLLVGNRHYSPANCAFIQQTLNSFVVDRKGDRGLLMIGVRDVHKKSKSNPFLAQCSNPFTAKQEYLGHYRTELMAHKVWQAKKHEHALKLAELQDDPRIAESLRKRYAPDTDWTTK